MSTLLTYKPQACVVPELCKPIIYLSLKSPSNERPSNQHLHCTNTPLNSPPAHENNPQASLSPRNNSLSQSFLPSVYIRTGCGCPWCNLCKWPLSHRSHYMQSAAKLVYSLSQGSAELLPRTFTIIIQRILTELLSLSAFGKSPGRVCVYVSKTD